MWHATGRNRRVGAPSARRALRRVGILTGVWTTAEAGMGLVGEIPSASANSSGAFLERAFGWTATPYGWDYVGVQSGRVSLGSNRCG